MSEKAAGKGAPRHFSKPWVDPDVLLNVFSEQKNLIRFLKAFCNAMPKKRNLLLAEKTAELHPNPVRTALVQLLSSEPSLNNTKYRGKVWASNKQTRICWLLYHVRKLADTNLASAAAKLTSHEDVRLQRLLELVKPKESAADADLAKGELNEKKKSSLPVAFFEKRKAAEELASSTAKNCTSMTVFQQIPKGFPKCLPAALKVAWTL